MRSAHVTCAPRNARRGANALVVITWFSYKINMRNPVFFYVGVAISRILRFVSIVLMFVIVLYFRNPYFMVSRVHNFKCSCVCSWVHGGGVWYKHSVSPIHEPIHTHEDNPVLS